MEGRVFIGTAGWSIASRHADAFSTAGTHLERYARVLGAVEINSSFYRPHRRQTYERWASSAPAGFCFSVKLPRTITHERRLSDVDDLTDAFLDQAAGLGAKLGVILAQLPPNLAFDAARAGAFLSRLRASASCGLACEPRHRSWFGGEADALLRGLSIARVAADPPRPAGAGEPGGWPGLVYRRLHGSPRMYFSNYDDAALRGIARRIEAEKAGAEVWCIFDNTAAGHALGNALAVASMLR